MIAAYTIASHPLPMQAKESPPPEGKSAFSFAVTCDMRNYAGPSYDTFQYFRGTCEAIATVGPGAFMISPGDIDPPDNVKWTIEQHIGVDYLWYPVVGNHEEETASDMTWLRAYNPVSNPLPHIVSMGPPNCEETTYSFDYGNVHFIVINEYYDGTSDTATSGDVPDPLYNWLVADIDATTQQHVFVIGHEPAYPQPDADNGRIRHLGDSLDQYPTNRDRFWNLLRDRGVVAYLCGHTHNYSIVQLDSVWQVDAGHCRGIGDTGARSTFIMVHVDGDQITYTTYRDDSSGGPYYPMHSGVLKGVPFTPTPTPNCTDQTLIAPGSVWTYLDNGTDQGIAWREIAFDDSNWSSGPAQLGYGDGDEATVVFYGINTYDKYVATYFRHGFSVPDPSAYDLLSLAILRDDGAVIYLNGTEVYRTNMPGGTITYETYASTTVGGTSESTFYTTAIDPGLLVTGPNVIAVEIHQSDPTSSDISFDFELIGCSNLPVPTATPTPTHRCLDESLVAAGATWRYLDDGSDQGTAWYAPSFDDSGWASGPAELGYGDGEYTTVSYGPDPNNKYVTTYLRHSFSITASSRYEELSLGIQRDDGAVVYLNGLEAHRSNMPTGTITCETFAASTVGGADESTFFTAALDPALLLDGTNVIAVEIHQSGVTSSDISFDLELIGCASRITPTPTTTQTPPATSTPLLTATPSATPLPTDTSTPPSAPTPSPTSSPTGTPTPTATPLTAIDLTVLLHGVYDTDIPANSRGVSGDYGVTIELRDTSDGAGSNYRYHNVALNETGILFDGVLDLGSIIPGFYYLVVSQLNHLAVITEEATAFHRSSKTTINLSDTTSLNFLAVSGGGLYLENDGRLSLHSGNGEKENNQALYINVLDALVWVYANGTTPGYPGWDIRADYDANGLINAIDALKWVECNGAHNTVEIEPLSLSITVPSQGAIINGEVVTVSGLVNDNNAAVEINGITTTVTGGTFIANDVPLPLLGDNSLTATAQDLGGNVAIDEITVTRTN